MTRAKTRLGTVTSLVDHTTGDLIDIPTGEDQEEIIYNTGKGVPTTYTKQTSSSRTFLTQRGQLNHYRMRPKILNEHVETAREVQGVVTSSNIVGQFFKASHNNINGNNATFESAAYAVIDDFESYANSAALQAVWVAGNSLALLETSIVSPFDSSTQSMELNGTSLANTWTMTISATDLTGFTSSYDSYFSHAYNLLKLGMVLIDNVGNTKSLEVVQPDDTTWEHIEVKESQFTDDQGTPMDITNTVGLRFEITDAQPNSAIYIDNLQQAPAPGSIQAELWDMGATLPVDGVTSLDDGTQYTELGDRGINGGTVVSSVSVNLIGGKRVYHIGKFIAGTALEIPGNTLLTVGNYYAIVYRYVDTDVSVYGANTSYETDYYINGYAFTTPDDSTGITKIGDYNDLQFSIFSTQKVYLNTLIKIYDAEPGSDATESVYIEDKDMHIEEIVSENDAPVQSLIAEFKDRYLEFPLGGKFEVNHSDDFNDDVTKINILIGYMYEPLPTNG